MSSLSLSSSPSQETGQPETLSALEQMGVYFSSQIHDLNNQMACLSNTSLLLEMSTDKLPESTANLLQGMARAIQRLSLSVADFNTIRRTVKVNPSYLDQIDLSETIQNNLPVSWALHLGQTSDDAVRSDAHWLGYIVSRLIDLTGATVGAVHLTTGPLPNRRYTRTITTDPDDLFLRVHIVRDESSASAEDCPLPGGMEFDMTLELIRLMGAVISFGLGSEPDDILLALRLKSD